MSKADEIFVLGFNLCMTKSAQNTGWWKSITDWMDQYGIDRRHLIGGLGGMLMGGLGGYKLGGGWGSAALGGLAGGALGSYGGGYLPKWWENSQNQNNLSGSYGSRDNKNISGGTKKKKKNSKGALI